MSPLRQTVLSLAVLGAGLALLTNVSEDARRLVRALGIDPALFAFAAATQTPEAAPRPQGPVRVVMAEVRHAKAATTLRTIGTGLAVRSVTLYTQSAGILAELDFTPGARVEKGHVLAVLDQQTELIAEARAELAVAAARADLERLSRLASRNAAAPVALDEARRALERAELDLRAASLALERRVVRAPFAGWLGIAEVSVGDYLRSDMPIGVIDDRSEIAIDLNAPERYASRVTLGQPVRAETVALPGRVFEGRIVAIDNQVNRQSRTLRLRAAIDNPDDVLRPGLSFSVALDFPGEVWPSFPALAMQWRAEGPYVWAVRDGRAVQVAVEVVERRDERVLAKAELAEGDRVIVEGIHRLRPGVEVAEAPAPAAPGG